MKATWLANVLRTGDVSVIEMSGWQTRGYDMKAIHGVVEHHTATSPAASDQNVANLLRDGRPGLAGPLSQLGLDRSGRFWVIAAGRSNHNGYGLWGNDSIGIEAFNNGTGEPWSDIQMQAWYKGTAAILKHLGLGVDRVKGHKETDPDRKVDPAGVDMNAFRSKVQIILAPPVSVPVGPPIYTGILQENTVRASLEIPTGADGNGWRDLDKPWDQYRGVSVQGFDPPYMGGYANPKVTAHNANGKIRVVVTEWLPNAKAWAHVNLATN